MTEAFDLVSMSFTEAQGWHRVQEPVVLDPSKAKVIPHLMSLMSEVGQRSTCAKGKVGCVVTDTNLKFQGLGYNRKPKGLEGVSCGDLGCDVTKKCRLTIHAEVDAFSQVDWTTDKAGHVLFLPKSNCLDCLKQCVSRNVKFIVFERPYRLPEQDLWAYERFVKNCGIKFYQVAGFYDVHV